MHKTIIEPFRIKSVEPIQVSNPEQRATLLQNAYFNPFLLHSDNVVIDFLTDSGTSAMSVAQWAKLIAGDESYAGSHSWLELEAEVKDLTGHDHILPTHQGRAAERILYGHLGGQGKIFISNTHFDTTRANIEYSGAEAIDCPVNVDDDSELFKGNMDLDALVATINDKRAENIAAIILTVTNNTGGGQPVSMENAKAIREICDKHSILFVLDSCRVAENAYFIREREQGYQNKEYREIAQEMYRLADASVMSAKKDGLVNIGGFLSLCDEEMAAACTNLLIITEGYTTYGGMAGRDLAALAQGLREVFDDDYLNYRIKSTAYLGENLQKMGIPLITPIGGHAVYIDAGAFYPNIPADQYPGQALLCQLYVKGGIRAVEVGSVMFGTYNDEGKLIPAAKELVRLAIPRRVYTQSHIDYVLEVFGEVLADKENARGLRITKEPKFLRHFTAHFEEV